ncbi:MAG: CHASE3 domain-containing protein [Armatimonadetes bacterium]|nr:CHASE3 domain-containing protein [Armatimonadota bacterium]
MASFDQGTARAALLRWEVGMAIAYIASIAFLATNGIISNHTIDNTRDIQRNLVQALDSRVACEALMSTMNDAETGQRGYLLTKNDAFLVPYNRAFDKYPADIKRLQDSAQKLGLPNEHFNDIERIAHARMQSLSDTIASSRRSPTGAVDFDAIRRGKQLMDRFRAEIETIKTQISKQVDKLKSDAQTNSRSAVRTNAVSTLAGIVLSTAAFFFALRLIRKRLELQEIRARTTSDLERQVKLRTAELKHANDEMEAFSYSVSHDLRAPRRELDDEGKEAIHRIKFSCRKMSDLIDDLLVLSRVTRGEMKPEEIDLSTLVADIMGEIRQQADRKDVMIEIESGVMATADRRLTRVLLENLLRNAWKFTGKNEQTTIRFGRTHNQQGKVCFVQDNGVGFDPEYSTKIFLPFQRLHRDQEFEGSGIGLAIVHRIVERHGGRIWAEGEPNKGATFYFALEPAE